MEQGLLTIAEMSSAYNITFRTLRFYEQKGLIAPRRRSGQRLYSVKDRTRLELIVTGKRLGFTIAEIKRFIDEMPAATQGETTEPVSLVDGLERDLVAQQIAALLKRKEELQSAIDELQVALTALTTSSDA